MKKTVDLALVQRTIIDTFHKEGKSQRVITERCDSSQSAVSKHCNNFMNSYFSFGESFIKDLILL